MMDWRVDTRRRAAIGVSDGARGQRASDHIMQGACLALHTFPRIRIAARWPRRRGYGRGAGPRGYAVSWRGAARRSIATVGSRSRTGLTNFSVHGYQPFCWRAAERGDEGTIVTFDVIGNAEKVVEPLRATVDESESLRQLSDRAVALLHESGATRLVSPARYGGYELPPRALVEAERVIAHGSPAASWVLMVTGAHTFARRADARRGSGRGVRRRRRHVDPGRSDPRGTCMPTDGGTC